MNLVKQSFYLTDKIAVITGGAGLLGEKYAEAIAELGGVPILLDINNQLGTKKAQRISDEYKINCEYQFCDITDELQILSVKDNILKKYGKIDILINNAAIDPKIEVKSKKNLSRLEYFSMDQWNLELSVGLTGAMLCSKVFGYEMSNNGKGVILNISSDLGIIAPNQDLYKIKELSENEQPVKPVTYSVIKHGLIGLTRYIATYWADKGIRCNALCPGGVNNNQPDEFLNKISRLIPMGRMASQDEYKAAIVFLVSEASSYMNGAVISVDGGRSCW